MVMVESHGRDHLLKFSSHLGLWCLTLLSPRFTHTRLNEWSEVSFDQLWYWSSIHPLWVHAHSLVGSASKLECQAVWMWFCSAETSAQSTSMSGRVYDRIASQCFNSKNLNYGKTTTKQTRGLQNTPHDRLTNSNFFHQAFEFLLCVFSNLERTLMGTPADRATRAKPKGKDNGFFNLQLGIHPYKRSVPSLPRGRGKKPVNHKIFIFLLSTFSLWPMPKFWAKRPVCNTKWKWNPS